LPVRLVFVCAVLPGQPEVSPRIPVNVQSVLPVSTEGQGRFRWAGRAIPEIAARALSPRGWMCRRSPSAANSGHMRGGPSEDRSDESCWSAPFLARRGRTDASLP
jgi:hypothetical protein